MRRNLGDETISVNVGIGDSVCILVLRPSTIPSLINSQRQNFNVHKSILQQCTTYFESNKLFDTMAGKQGLIFLNDENPKVFKLLVDWAYNGMFHLSRMRNIWK